MSDTHATSPDGFDAGPTPLRPQRTDIPLARRRHAALVVLAIGQLYTPEDIVAGMRPDIAAAFGHTGWLNEALAHVDLLLDVLVPQRHPA